MAAAKVAVLAPVLNRPERVRPLVESLAAASPDARLFLLANYDDRSEIAAIVAAGEHPHLVQWSAGPGDWARKINWGFRRARHLGYDWMLLGADDLHFHPGWDTAAVAAHADTGACVIGTNDLGNPTVQSGRHSTHPLVHRDYLECGTADEDGLIVHEGYDHNFVDTEFVETARARDTWTFAAASHVEHLHPFWGKGPDDSVYEKGRAHYHLDRALYQRRRSLWA